MRLTIRAAERIDGWLKERMHGSTAFVASSSIGKNQLRVDMPFYAWLALSSHIGSSLQTRSKLLFIPNHIIFLIAGYRSFPPVGPRGERLGASFAKDTILYCLA